MTEGCSAWAEGAAKSVTRIGRARTVRSNLVHVDLDGVQGLTQCGLIRALEERGHRVQSDVVQPSRALDFEHADVLLLSAGLESRDIAERVTGLRQVGVRAGIAIALNPGAEEFATSSLEAGADLALWLGKRPLQCAFEIEALARRVRGEWTRSSVAGWSGGRVDIGARSILANGTSVQLGRTTFRLMLYFLEHMDRWLTEPRIIRDVFGTHHAPGSSIVRVHICSLRKALQPLPLAVEHRRSVGYRLVERSAHS